MPYRYIPKNYLRQPQFFGRRPDAKWKPHKNAPQAEVAASYYQHLAACEVLRISGEKDWSLADLAAKVGVNVDTLRRKLHGEGPATIDDVTGWALAVKTVTVLPAPADIPRMLPPV